MLKVIIMIKKVNLCLLISLLFLISNCKKDTISNPTSEGNVTDADGNVYSTIKIGSQVWFQQNLATTKLNDGTPIPSVPLDSWNNTYTPAYCWYNDTVKYKSVFGALYNWWTVKTGTLCPLGWHVPTEGDWNTLVYNLGGIVIVAGIAMKSTATGNSTGEWLYNTGTVGTNSSGFTALPGGWLDPYNNIGFNGMGTYAFWWSKTTEDGNYGDFWLNYINEDPNLQSNSYVTNSQCGLSVRCIKNN